MRSGTYTTASVFTAATCLTGEVEASVAPLLEKVGNTEPIALLTDPAPHAMRQRRAYFGPMVGDIGVTWRKATLFQSQANLVSLA